jgi:hypothetical protein
MRVQAAWARAGPGPLWCGPCLFGFGMRVPRGALTRISRKLLLLLLGMDQLTPASKGTQKVLVSLQQHKKKERFQQRKKRESLCDKLLLTLYYSSYKYLWSWYEMNVNTPRSVCA